jgi:hypothetical protein
MVLRLAIQRHRQNARDRRFANAAMSAEDVAMRNPSLLDGVLQRPRDVVLPNDVGKFLWPVFARENLVTHGRKSRLYGAKLWNGESWSSLVVGYFQSMALNWGKGFNLSLIVLTR